MPSISFARGTDKKTLFENEGKGENTASAFVPVRFDILEQGVAMKKQSILRIVNIFLILAFLGAAGAIMLYRYGPDSLQGSGDVYEVHETCGLIFIGLAVIHIILNFGWIVSSYFKRRK